MAEQLDKKIVKAIEEVLALELYASYHYKSAFQWASVKQYVNSAAFFLQESKDEQKHANILIQYATDYGVTPALSDINSPDQDFVSMDDVLMRSLELEDSLGEKYEEVYKMALEVCPMAAIDLFQQFLAIQSQAVREYRNLIDHLKGYGEGMLAVKLFDEQVMGK